MTSLRAAVLAAVSICSVQASELTFQYGAFDTLHVYQADTCREVALFISGDAGWRPEVIEMARHICAMNTTVVGVTLGKIMARLNSSKNKCVYPAGDFEMLSKFAQQKTRLPRYLTPVLLGYAQGGALAYALVAQAPAGTFKGALCVGFCPAYPGSVPPCQGSGLKVQTGPKGKGFSLLPDSALSAPLIAFQGTIHCACNADSLSLFIKRTGHAEEINVATAGAEVSGEKTWVPQFKQAFDRLLQMDEEISPKPAALELTSVAGLPLTEVAPTGQSPSKAFAIILTGDGGWAGIDRGIANALSAFGIPVVGWNSLQYYWKPRTPEEAAADLDRIIKHYCGAWNMEKAILIGYSFGANVLPFLANRLDQTAQARVGRLIYIGLSPEAEFEFHVAGWIGGKSKNARPTIPEIRKVAGLAMGYIYGTEEHDNVASELDPYAVTMVALPGGHHFNGKFDKIARAIVSMDLK